MMPLRGILARITWVLLPVLAVSAAFPDPASASSTLRQRPVPIVADGPALEVCGWPTMPAGTTCALYDGNGDASLGESTFGFANLDTWATSSTATCTNAGASNLSDWVTSGYPGLLALNGNPRGSAPTYVCRDTDNVSSVFAALTGLVGSVVVVPVNDCDGQVGVSGMSDPCPQEPDKFDAVTFDRFRIDQVLRGDDPAAIGTPGPPATPGYCGIRPSDPISICLLLRAVAPTVGLDVIVRGRGGGVVRGREVRCRRAEAPCHFTVPWGGVLRLVARPNAGARFAGWTRGCDGTGACRIPVRHHIVVRARFVRTRG